MLGLLSHSGLWLFLFLLLRFQYKTWLTATSDYFPQRQPVLDLPWEFHAVGSNFSDGLELSCPFLPVSLRPPQRLGDLEHLCLICVGSRALAPVWHLCVCPLHDNALCEVCLTHTTPRALLCRAPGYLFFCFVVVTEIRRISFGALKQIPTLLSVWSQAKGTVQNAGCGGRATLVSCYLTPVFSEISLL